MLAPETDGLELAVTVKPEVVEVPLAGEVMVIMSLVVGVPLARAAGVPHRLTKLRIMQRKIILVDTTERAVAE